MGAGKAVIDRAWAKRRMRRNISDAANSDSAIKDLAWHNEHSVSKFDTTHRKMGWWAIDTVNANAWTATADYLCTTSADMVVAQETKLLDG